MSETSPFFHGGHRILVFSDPYSFNDRNNLKKNSFIKRECWVETYSWFPKLTMKHITLSPFSTHRLRLASLVLSHSVAAGVSFIGRLLGGNCDLETACFIENIDRLFNAFNGGKKCSTQNMGHALFFWLWTYLIVEGNTIEVGNNKHVKEYVDVLHTG